MSRNSRPTILVVEDDPATAMLLTDVLGDAGYTVEYARTGGEAEARLHGRPDPPDLVLLDLRLPDTDGLVLCASIKSRYLTRIIIVSASARRQDRILALRLGADDFIGKPFEVEELLARIEAVLRRPAHGLAWPTVTAARATAPAAAPAPRRAERVGDLTLIPEQRRIQLGDKVLALTPSEYRVLAALIAHPDEVVTRDELARMVWGHSSVSTGRALDVHIARLRAKLAASPRPAPQILTIRGQGYRLMAERSDLTA